MADAGASPAPQSTTPVDPRLEFLASVIQKSLRIKPDRWTKLLLIDESRKLIHEFLDNPEPRLIIFTQSGPGVLGVSSAPLNSSNHPALLLATGVGSSTASRLKSLYFLKKRTEPVDKDEPRRSLLYGDISPNPLEQVLAFLDEVVAPVLEETKNSKSQGNLPASVTSMLDRQSRALRGTVARARGLLEAKTMLYWPWTAQNNEQLPTKIEMEQCVQKWAQQLCSLLESEEKYSSFRSSLIDEINYWKNRCQDLENVFEQLKQPVVRQMAAVLEESGSAQSVQFKNLLRRVIAALAEAQEINLHIKPMSKPLEALDTSEITDVTQPIRLLVHTVALVWCSCAYFRQPVKLGNLLRQVASALIDRCRVFLDSRSIFTWETEEALEKISLTKDAVAQFRLYYKEERQNIAVLSQRMIASGKASFITASITDSKELWNPPEHLIFQRLNKFDERLANVEKVFQLVQEFARLSRVELSAMGGRSLTIQVQSICQQFNDYKAPIISGFYGDSMDPDNDAYKKAIATFIGNVGILEERLCSILGHALNDSNNALNASRVIQLLGTFLERPAMRAKIQQSFPRLISLSNQEINACKEILKGIADVATEDDEIFESLQLVSATFKRASSSYAACCSMAIGQGSHSFRTLEENFQDFSVLAKQRRTRIEQTWETRIRNLVIVKPLFEVDSNGEVHSGIENVATKIVIEMRQMDQLRSDIQQPGQSNEKQKSLSSTMKLVDLIVTGIDSLKRSLTDYMADLFQPKIETITENILVFQRSESWNWDSGSPQMQIHLKNTAEEIMKLQQSQRKILYAVDSISQIANGWTKQPIIERVDDYFLLGEQLHEFLNKKYIEYSQVAKKLAAFVNDVQQAVSADDLNSAAFKCITNRMDDIVYEGLTKTISGTWTYFLDSASRAPVAEIFLEISKAGIKYHPGIDRRDGADSLFDLIDNLLNGITKIATSIGSFGTSRDFYKELCEDQQLKSLREEILLKLGNAVCSIKSSVKFLDKYSFLWTTDCGDFLINFINNGATLEGSSAKISAGDTPASLQQFHQQLQHLQHWKEEVSTLLKNFAKKTTVWLKLNIEHAIVGIEKEIDGWSSLLLDHITNYVTENVNDLEVFLQEAEEGLNWRTSDAESGKSREVLLEMMGHLARVRSRQNATDELFIPLQQAARLLQDYDNELPEELLIKLHFLPQRWETIKQAATVAKQQVASLQANEIVAVRKKLSAFEVKQLQFREEFHRMEFFKSNCSDPYEVLDFAHKRITELETELQELSSWASLFEVAILEFRPLRNCRKETVLLKILWDYTSVVHTCVNHWKTTNWKEIDVERMEIECKHFAKHIRGLDKEMRSWDAYIGLEAYVRDLLTSLKAVAELQNPALRERHWAQLIEATKRKQFLRETFTVNFVTDSETTLEDLLALDLHRYEEEVRTVVDRAVREVSMEKTLRELEATWATLELGKEPHPRTGLTLLKASDELIATLEENQVQLQTLATSKYVAHLMADVQAWQRKLALADSVLALWCEVQRSWSHLESIFAGPGSVDIREQLPEDAKRFDETNTAFKTLLNRILQEPNVVAIATRPGILQELQDLEYRLQLCEKALAQYLESKRKAFPRFYFVATADLLDILSNGNHPHLIQRHLTKLFDGVAKINLEPTSGSKTQSDIATKAVGVWAKDGEYLPLTEPVTCTGQVEVWLNALTSSIRNSLRHLLQEAVACHEEKSKDCWVLEFPAQVALTASQISWNAEVSTAFQRLEEGYENAMKDLFRKQVSQLNSLINLLGGDLSPGDRQKIMTLCTIDVHSRDVISRLVQNKVESSQSFAWQAQLRHSWSTSEKDCFVDICDARFRYWYEYLGNTPRLVVTPLTDRCYITLTQSLHLTMGGAPTGPAGTGKTETTKDLGRALGMLVYVFNCSEQMDYKTCANVYKGLAQTGAWGCFDEFNRISVEVLSVVAVQIRSIQEAIRQKRKRFFIMEEEIPLEPTVGLFVTMNPGYAGRTELPENLKSLFRPCAMIIPDSDLICEIMLVAEGFLEARNLARKLVTLYSLCRQLLSKQDHYDWGLRAVKSVLILAGSSKRNNLVSGWTEEQLLLGALRDANMPRLISDDVPVFMALLGDLFPSVEANRLADPAMDRTVRQAALDLKLQPEDIFVTRVLQLHELLQVRHAVFMLGKAGTGKTQVWRTLLRTYALLRMRPVCADLDPKAVTSDELFGYVNPTTREWRDGLLSSILREQAAQSTNNPNAGPKWVVLDGDIDPRWIESLNTLMDDNKILTLASNERIALTPQMRLIFEISHLKSATPSSVSRAGILHLNTQDLGWTPYITSWIETRTGRLVKDNETEHTLQGERSHLTILMDKYIPSCLDVLRARFKTVVPMPEICHLQTLCRLLDCLLTPQVITSDSPRDVYELYFVFACIWAFGSALSSEPGSNHKFEFSQWWTSEFKAVRFPLSNSAPTVFDFCVDTDTQQLIPWTEKIPRFDPDPDLPIYTNLVPTVQTTCLKYFMDLLIRSQQPVLLVGNSGCGKTAMVEEALMSLPDDYAVKFIQMHHFLTSEMLQGILEKPLEKKAGRNYGPPGNKKLLFFLDDLNAPKSDDYGTTQAHTLLRQHLSYGHWYDRNKLIPKEIRNVQYIACMNPTSGTFTIDPRLQRHFTTFAISTPSNDVLHHIFNSWLQKHFGNPIARFLPSLTTLVPALVSASLTLHQRLLMLLQPTASKYLYAFNLRDLSALFKGLLLSTSETVSSPLQLLRLWAHEAHRVYFDRLSDEKDVELFRKAITDTVKKCFDRQSAADSTLESCCAILTDVDDVTVLKTPLLFCHFARGLGDTKYAEVEENISISGLLEQALASYNELNPAMDLVLFEDAINHVCRISRILELPRGHALLVGVGGSGKQSLARLAASVAGFDVIQFNVRPGYGVPELKTDLSAVFLKAGLKKLPTVLLLTDAQLVEESLLGPIHDFLATGEIPGLFSDEEVENIVTSVRNEVKALGLVDSWDTCWRFFLEQVKRFLHVILCCSPVGSTLRLRVQRFPALLGTMTVDYFLPWPNEALLSVSQRSLRTIELPLPANFLDSASQFMAHVHGSVNDACRSMLQSEGRYAYTTPKSFLEQLQLFKRLLEKQTTLLKAKVERLRDGLDRLRAASLQVDDLKERLAIQEVDLQRKTEEADRLIHVVRVETEKVRKEKILADAEERRVAVMAVEVAQRQKECEQDLERAEPALAAAQEALNTLNKANLTELKSFGTPPPAVTNVTAAVLVLLSPQGKIPKDRSWRAAKVMMGRVDQFLDCLINYDKEHIHPEIIKAIQPYLDNPEFDPEQIRSKSTAAAGLCSWVINIIKFFDVYCDVEPKRRALEEANAALSAAVEKEAAVKAKVSALEATLEQLTMEFEKANTEKRQCQEEAARTSKTLEQAHRLIHGLAAEKIRWSQAVEFLRRQEVSLPGDVLLTTAFVSYAGYFPKHYRQQLLNKSWIPFLHTNCKSIMVSESFEPVALLADSAQVAAWSNEGLPTDTMSVENAAILTTCERWPLLIDPQLQGLRWLKGHYANRLCISSQRSKGFHQNLERCLREGLVLIIEDVDEELDYTLEPLMSRQFIKKGRAIKLCDKEVDFHPEFLLILHTKLANPHFRPELQAQATLLNFTVTRDGLEDQLLGEVVRAERPDLERERAELVKQENEFKIALKNLEDDLLLRLSQAEGAFLANSSLVDSLEKTKATANDITEKAASAAAAAQEINKVRELYRPIAARASLMFFVISDLKQLNPLYQFSLKAFIGVFQRALSRSAPSSDISVRVSHMLDAITEALFRYTARGLFEADRLVFTSHLAFSILLASGEIDPADLDFFLRFPIGSGSSTSVCPMDFIPNSTWAVVKGLSATDEFRHLDRDIEASSKRWRKVLESEFPERERLPQEWKGRSPLQRLCILRALRPDRVTYGLKLFIEEKLGSRYVESVNVDLAQCVSEMGPSSPLCFILSPGVNPLPEIEQVAAKSGRSTENGLLHLVSLGQGQEASAEATLEKAAQSGYWVVLQNIHLVKKWLSTLERLLDRLGSQAHPEFLVFLSVQPPASKEANVIPQGLLESCIKLTSEPPHGIRANLHRALDQFDQESLEQCSREAEFKTLLFTLCYFHAVVTERRHFGTQGWNRAYPFSAGDLKISINVLLNYIEANGSSGRVPWEDLRYLLGEIMYGGHITDEWDRRLCRSYLEELLHPDLLEGELYLAPNFPSPPNRDYSGYHKYIEEALPPESTYLYGLHPNAEVGVLTKSTAILCQKLLALQPRQLSGSGGATSTKEEKVKQILDEILERLPEEFSLAEINSRLEEKTPFMVVIVQECERLNHLIAEIKRTLRELSLGLKGELSLTPDMEETAACLFLDQVPHRWNKLAYPSLLGLSAWISDLQLRHKELETWLVDFQTPPSVWLGGFFSPQSFLTAVMQTAARRTEQPLDRMTLSIEVTKKSREEITTAPRDGVYIHGLYLEGARWDSNLGVLAEAKLNELHPPMPVIYVKAVTQDKLDVRGTYSCPVYHTSQRGDTYVWNFHLKTRVKPSKWILAGTALLLQA